MSFTFIQSVWTIVVMVTFLGIVAWAYSGKRKSSFDEAARLPFDEEQPGADRKPDSE
ncbi:MAG: cbb3-type cytochrome c oxidase subunit 3 [Gammaproteobacteria bacterium]|jgi:cytochrome c oxidase cbb3-type subunit 4